LYDKPLCQPTTHHERERKKPSHGENNYHWRDQTYLEKTTMEIFTTCTFKQGILVKLVYNIKCLILMFLYLLEKRAVYKAQLNYITIIMFLCHYNEILSNVLEYQRKISAIRNKKAIIFFL
jgi:hypothetical protein